MKKIIIIKNPLQCLEIHVTSVLIHLSYYSVDVSKVKCLILKVVMHASANVLFSKNLYLVLTGNLPTELD